MAKLDLSQAQSSNMTGAVSNITIPSMTTDGINDGGETEYTNKDWGLMWGIYNAIPDLQSALILKSIWNVGRGYECEDSNTEAILDHISGRGKESFRDILFNMDLVKNINGDSYAEIIRDEDGTLINLKPLDPASINVIFDDSGIIKRYEQTAKTGGKGTIKFEPDEIFHLTCNRAADNMGGQSLIKPIAGQLEANNESFTDLRKIFHHQAKPFILWKLKTDDPVKIANVVAKIEAARNLSEDMFIPDDDDAIEYEIVQVNLSPSIFQWRDELRNSFYRTIRLPQILPGAGGQSTESESKTIYLGFEVIDEHEQGYLEEQVWQQLYLRIDLISPPTMQANLQQDSAKDASQGLGFQPNETQAGVGR